MASASSAPAPDPNADKLAALEQAILGAVETIDRLEEYTHPSPTPDNDGLKLNLCARPPTHKTAGTRCAFFRVADRTAMCV